MLVCDAHNKILACDARYPGSVHDSAIYRTSNVRHYLCQKYNNNEHVGHLIGDSGYPLEPWLFTPFQAVQEGTPEEQFNELHRSSRNVIERTNSILKGRFRCPLKHRVLHYHSAKAAYLIYAACVLRNIAVEGNIPLDDDNEEPDDFDEYNNNAVNDMHDNFFLLGRQARNEYVQRNF